MARVQSVERAIALLRAVGEDPRGLVELAGATHLPTSTAARLLATLEGVDAVRRDGDGRYHVGAAIAGLGSVEGMTVAFPRLVDIAAPVMRRLAGRVDEAVGLAVHAGTDIAMIAQVDVPRPVQAEDWTGSRWPLEAGCSGAVLMATWPQDEVDRLLATVHTPVDPAIVRRGIEAARQRGLAWSHGDYVEGLSSVSAAITDAQGRGYAVLQIYGPTYRFPQEPAVAEVETQLLAAVAELSGGPAVQRSVGRRAS